MSKQLKRSVITIAIALVVGVLLAIAGSQNSWKIGTIPGFAIAVASAYIVQWIAYIPAAITKTDRYFDATGSATYIVVTALLIAVAPHFTPLAVLLSAMVIIWAARLGVFLFIRNIRSGGDSRFDEIKGNKLRFLSVWTMQGLWVSLTAAAAWIAISANSSAQVTWLSYVGVAIWAIGLVFEVVADVQKSRFKADPHNQGKFIQSGLWSLSRHPNYFGEITLWVGVLVAAVPALSGWQWIALLSPVFVTLLLTKVSGIPLLEKKGQSRWGDDPEYKAYVERTSVLIPLPPKQ